jgi:hypothetical protein
MLEDCLSYLDGSIFNIESKITTFDETDVLANSESLAAAISTDGTSISTFPNDYDLEDTSRKLSISSKM